MKLTGILHFVLPLLLLPLIINAQKITVNASLDSNIILIGDQVHLWLDIERPENAIVQFPALQDTIMEGVEILEKARPDTLSSGGGMVKLREAYLITSFDSGVYMLPSFPFAFSMDTISDTLWTNPLVLGVQTMKVDTTKQAICDIKKPYDAPWSFWEFMAEYWYYFVIGLGVIVIGFLIYLYFRKRKKKEPLIRVLRKPEEPPHVIALRELDRLKNEKLWQQSRFKEYHTRLTEIIRQYLEDRFGITAMEQTTWEILGEWSNTGNVETKLYKALEQILVLADLVKFAKATPLPDENDMSMRNAYLFVNETTPVEKTNSGQEEKDMEEKQDV